MAKAAGNSPARARLRRLFREAFRTIRTALRTPVDLVISARLPWPDAGLHDVMEELRVALQRMRLLPERT